jgi:hypothetical protein
MQCIGNHPLCTSSMHPVPLNLYLAGVLFCRALASKAAQALLLLRTLSYQNLTRLAVRLDNVTRRQLKDLVSQGLQWGYCFAATILHQPSWLLVCHMV